MYTAHFGLTENPFSITPDPRYLYLSDRHREALAHLLYGAGESGGFVQLTGEVGTGKTTVCRAFLDQLPDHVDVALILNPSLTAPELLQALCDELRIEAPPGCTSTKELVDRLNDYLLDAHARGRRTVVIVDEAQNLRPDVLEQIRLLTNLETETHKLLQIFLVGQPELRQVLSQKGLRQVAQRITARYHLIPLARTETADYIRHRLSVAGCTRVLFTAGALRLIYRYTGGVPRLINNLCDRALLGAYATDNNRVSARIVRHALQELRGEPAVAWWKLPRYWLKVGPALVMALAGILALSAWWQDPAQLESVWAAVRAGLPSMLLAEQASSVPPATAQPEQPARIELGEVLRDPETHADRGTAENRLLAQWGITAPDTGLGLCEQAAMHGLKCLEDKGTWNSLRGYNRPAIIRLRDESGRTFYTVTKALEGDSITLDLAGRELSFPVIEVDRFWYGEFLLLWRPPVDGIQIIRPGSVGGAVQWLRQALDRVQGVQTGVQVPDPARFDAALMERVKEFQRSRGLAVDGIAGTETLIQLSAAAEEAAVSQSPAQPVQ